MDKNLKCKDCKYSRYFYSNLGYNSIELCCIYILIEKVPRGEPAGEQCSKFVLDENKHRYNGRLFIDNFPKLYSDK